MSCYITNSLEQAKKGKPWFSKTSQILVKSKYSNCWNKIHQLLQGMPSFIPERTTNYQLTKQSSILWRIRNELNSSKTFWSFAKKIGNSFTKSLYPLLTNVDSIMAVLSEEKVELFASNSTLDPQGNNHQKFTKQRLQTPLHLPQSWLTLRQPDRKSGIHSDPWIDSTAAS